MLSPSPPSLFPRPLMEEGRVETAIKLVDCEILMRMWDYFTKITSLLYLSYCQDDESDSALSPSPPSLFPRPLMEEGRVQLQPDPILQASSIPQPRSSSLVATDVTIADGDLTAKLISKDQPQIETKPLILILSVYQDSILRLKIEEDPSLSPPKKCFEFSRGPVLMNKNLILQALQLGCFRVHSRFPIWALWLGAFHGLAREIEGFFWLSATEMQRKRKGTKRKGRFVRQI